MKLPETIYGPGTKVRKISGKPFKSSEKVNTIKEIVEHPYKKTEDGKGVPSYSFLEDESIVECIMCTISE